MSEPQKCLPGCPWPGPHKDEPAAPPAGLREALEEIANWNAHTELCGSPRNADVCICGWTEIEAFARDALANNGKVAAPSCGHPIDVERLREDVRDAIERTTR